MTVIRGVLLAGKFKTQHELNLMSSDDQRNTLIFELSTRTNQSGGSLQGMDDASLAGMGAMFVFLREGGIRSDADLQKMSADDQRNVLIVEIAAETLQGQELQGLSNMDLVRTALGKSSPGGLNQDTFLRGVLLAGKFRTHHELNAMTSDDQRNTLIVELTAHTNQSNFQSFDDFALAGMGAVLAFLRETGIRADAALKTMSADDQRNVLIVEIDAQTHLGAKLQGLRSMDIVLAGLGVDPVFFHPLPPIQPSPVRYSFQIDSIEVASPKASRGHTDSDWLTILVSVTDTVTKNIQTFPTPPILIGASVGQGSVITGPFSMGLVEADSPLTDANTSELAIVNYLIMNLGSSKDEEQFAQAVKVTDKVVAIVGPIIGAAIGGLTTGDPEQGFKIGQEVAKAVDTAIGALSDVFDFLGIHFAPPNCNGEVLHDTLTFSHQDLAQAAGQVASRDYTGPRENSRCNVPQSKVNFWLSRHRCGQCYPIPSACSSCGR